MAVPAVCLPVRGPFTPDAWFFVKDGYTDAAVLLVAGRLWCQECARSGCVHCESVEQERGDS